eukprot:2745179-Amphidinium_carterae.1
MAGQEDSSAMAEETGLGQLHLRIRPGTTLSSSDLCSVGVDGCSSSYDLAMEEPTHAPLHSTALDARGDVLAADPLFCQLSHSAVWPQQAAYALNELTAATSGSLHANT